MPDALAFLLILLAAGSVELEGANVLTLIILAAAGVLFISVFVLVGLGRGPTRRV